jgi:hypothetical protein
MSISAFDIVCYVDPQAGYVLNVRQGGNASCTVGGTQVVIPSAGRFMTKVEMAMDKEVPFVGRFAFHLRDTLDSKPVVHKCGWAGGDAVSLFPPGNIVWRIDIGCMPVTPVAMGRRRRSLLQMQNGTRYAVNPGLVNPIVVSSAVVTATTTSGSPPLSASTDPTGVVKGPPVSVNLEVAAVAAAVAFADAVPPACAGGQCTTPFSPSSSAPGAPVGGVVSSPAGGPLVVPLVAGSPAGSPPVLVTISMSVCQTSARLAASTP